MKRELLVVSLAAVSCACATTGTMRNAPLSKGKDRVFRAGFAQVMLAARTAVPEAGFSIQEVSDVDENAAVIIAEKAGNLFSYGERVRVLVQADSEEECTVRVYTKKKLATNLFAKGDWSKTIFGLIEDHLTEGPAYLGEEGAVGPALKQEGEEGGLR